LRRPGRLLGEDRVLFDDAHAGPFSLLLRSPWGRGRSVAVVVRLVRAFDLYADAGGLLGTQRGQLHAERVQVETGDLEVREVRGGPRGHGYSLGSGWRGGSRASPWSG